MVGRSHLFPEPGFSEGDSILQALYGFLFVVSCEGEVFFASRTVEQYLGFHQSDIIHQSVMELIHSEDREEFKRQLSWNSALPNDKAEMPLHEVLLPENIHHLYRSFTVRFRCLLDNTSGFITLEINGWIRVLHGQNLKTEEPQMALFATCCPFGPMSLLDLPSRDLTFKSKHKMDLSPLSMDSRGRMVFGYTDRDLATKMGYDLIHPDDLSYFAAAHQELIKTGSSGLIAYRWQTKELSWIWLQSSCRVVYKNSKPDFVICTHRQLTEDEGQDLVVKRGNEFKLPYPLLDIDICSGFGFSDEEVSPKVKGGKSKKTKAPLRDYLQTGRKRRCPYREPLNGVNGCGSYPVINSYMGQEEIKSDLVYPYAGGNYALEPELYRAPGYHSFSGAAVYPTSEPYKLDSDKHSYSNGYYLDHRQYSHTLSYHNNGYADLMVQSSKYGYDLPKYGLDGYSIDLSKKVHYDDNYNTHLDSFRKYTPYDYSGNRVNGHLDSMDLRHPSVYNAGMVGGMGEVNGPTGPTSCLSTPPLLRPEHTNPQILKYDQSQNHLPADSKQSYSTSGATSHAHDVSTIRDVKTQQTFIPYQQSSVIKSVTGRASSPVVTGSMDQSSCSGGGLYSQNSRTVATSSSDSWLSCTKSHPDRKITSTPLSENMSPSQQTTTSVLVSSPSSRHAKLPEPEKDVTILSPATVSSCSALTRSTPTSVIHSPDRVSHVRSCDKQPHVLNGIPVPVVKTSPWVQHSMGATPGAYDMKDWSAVGMGMESCSNQQKSQCGMVMDRYLAAPNKLRVGFDML
ncbi:uncharacterized protein LOC135481123 isoform X2 [Liolophura sinensis]